MDNQPMRPWVMRWLILSLFFMSGMKTTFVLALPTAFRVYRYRICIAALLFS